MTREALNRDLGLIQEVQRGFRSVKRGLHEIDRLALGNDFYDPPVIFLATGIERILKCMICMHFKHTHGTYPTRKDGPWNFKDGHDLLDLKRRVAIFCVSFEGTSRAGDYQVLTTHPQIDNLLGILSEYGRRSRYHDLDSVLMENRTQDVGRSLDKLQADLAIAAHGVFFLADLASSHSAPAAFERMNRQLKALVELFMRAISRQFVFGAFQSESQRFVADFSPFHRIEDADLGTREY